MGREVGVGNGGGVREVGVGTEKQGWGKGGMGGEKEVGVGTGMLGWGKGGMVRTGRWAGWGSGGWGGGEVGVKIGS